MKYPTAYPALSATRYEYSNLERHVIKFVLNGVVMGVVV